MVYRHIPSESRIQSPILDYRSSDRIILQKADGTITRPFHGSIINANGCEERDSFEELI